MVSRNESASVLKTKHLKIALLTLLILAGTSAVWSASNRSNVRLYVNVRPCGPLPFYELDRAELKEIESRLSNLLVFEPETPINTAGTVASPVNYAYRLRYPTRDGQRELEYLVSPEHRIYRWAGEKNAVCFHDTTGLFEHLDERFSPRQFGPDQYVRCWLDVPFN